MGMRVDVVSGWRTSRREDRWRRRMTGDNVSFFDVDVTVWSSHREAEVVVRHTSAQTCMSTSRNRRLGICVTKYPRNILGTNLHINCAAVTLSTIVIVPPHFRTNPRRYGWRDFRRSNDGCHFQALAAEVERQGSLVIGHEAEVPNADEALR